MKSSLKKRRNFRQKTLENSKRKNEDFPSQNYSVLTKIKTRIRNKLNKLRKNPSPRNRWYSKGVGKESCKDNLETQQLPQKKKSRRDRTLARLSNK